MKMLKISINGESMDSENEINELMDLHDSHGSFKEVDGELIENESIDDLLNAYEYETDMFAFEVMDIESFKNSLQYLKICKDELFIVNNDEREIVKFLFYKEDGPQLMFENSKGKKQKLKREDVIPLKNQKGNKLKFDLCYKNDILFTEDDSY